MNDTHKKAFVSLYGNEGTVKAWCQDCKREAFVIEGILQCCDTPLKKKPPIGGIRRESPVAAGGKRVYPKAKCEKCGVEFDKTREWSRYCSAMCRWEAWNAENPRVPLKRRNLVKKSSTSKKRGTQP